MEESKIRAGALRDLATKGIDDMKANILDSIAQRPGLRKRILNNPKASKQQGGRQTLENRVTHLSELSSHKRRRKSHKRRRKRSKRGR